MNTSARDDMTYEARDANSETGAMVVAAAATAARQPEEINPELLHAVVLRDDAGDERVEILDLEEKLPSPWRKRGSVTVFTAESLAHYVNDHRVPGTALYADVEQTRVVAIINGHEPNVGRLDDPDEPAIAVEKGSAGWGDHHAALEVRHTPEWKHWASRDGQIGAQDEFALHVEHGLDEIREPAAATLLEMAQHFEASTSVNFRSVAVLDNGQRGLLFDESIDAKAGRSGQIVIPKEFVLGLAPFEGSPEYKVVAHLRYRIREGRLTIGYQLVRPADVVRAAFDDVLAVVEDETSLTALRGRYHG